VTAAMGHETEIFPCMAITTLTGRRILPSGDLRTELVASSLQWRREPLRPPNGVPVAMCRS